MLDLTPVTFKWKDETKGTSLQYGLIAEDVDKVCPELVVYKVIDDKKDNVTHRPQPVPETVKYHELPVHLLSIVKKQKAEIEELKAQNEALNKRLDALEAVLTR